MKYDEAHKEEEEETLKETMLRRGGLCSVMLIGTIRTIYINRNYKIMVSHNDINLTMPNNINVFFSSGENRAFRPH